MDFDGVELAHLFTEPVSVFPECAPPPSDIVLLLGGPKGWSNTTRASFDAAFAAASVQTCVVKLPGGKHKKARNWTIKVLMGPIFVIFFLPFRGWN